MNPFRRLFGPKGDLSAEETAELLGVGVDAVERLVDFGYIRPASLQPLRFDRKAVADYLAVLEEHRANADAFYRAGERMGLDD